MLADQAGEAQENRLLVLRIGVAPDAALERFSRCLDGPIDVGLAAVGDMGEYLPVDRRDAREGRAVERGDIGAVDEGAPLDGQRGGAGGPGFTRGRSVEHRSPRRVEAERRP